MADPLSPVASIATLLGIASESVKFLSLFFHQFKEAPAEIHQWLGLLESLSATLEGLSTLDAASRLPTNVTQKLSSCLAHLQTCVDGISEDHARLIKDGAGGKKSWNGKGKRAWTKIKWTAVGDRKKRKVIEVVTMYHFELSMELFKLMTAFTRPNMPITNHPGELGADIDSQRGPSGGEICELPVRQGGLSELPACFREPAELPACPNVIPVSRMIPRPSTLRAPAVLTTTMDMSSVALKQEPVISRRASCLPQQSMRSVMWLYWKLSACKIIARAGPMTRSQSRGNISERRKREGFGGILSISCTRHWQRQFNISLYLHWDIERETRISLDWNLDFPRLISVKAEIFDCVRRGSIEEVKELLTSGKATARDINVFGISLLHTASKRGNIDLVKLLIQEGADVNAQDEDGESPLHGALAADDNYTVVRTLIESGADIALRAADGQTPLHTHFNSTMREIVTKDHWIEPARPDSKGMSITHFLAWSSRTGLKAFRQGCRYDEADFWSVDSLGRTCLHFASARGNLEILPYLLQRASRFEIDMRDTHGRPAFHYVSQSSRAANVIDMFVAIGCGINATDKIGQTALHWAARWRNLKAAKRLAALEVGGKLSILSQEGLLPSDLVCRETDPALHTFLEDLESSMKSPNEPENSMNRRQNSTEGTHAAVAVRDLAVWGSAIPIWLIVIGLCVTLRALETHLL